MAILYRHESHFVLAVYDISHLQVVYDKFVAYFLSHSIRSSQHFSQSSHGFIHQQGKEAILSQTHLWPKQYTDTKDSHPWVSNDIQEFLSNTSVT